MRTLSPNMMLYFITLPLLHKQSEWFIFDKFLKVSSQLKPTLQSNKDKGIDYMYNSRIKKPST